MSFAYRAYGLCCVSNVAIPGFTSENTPQFADLNLTVSLERPDWVLGAAALPKQICFSRPRPQSSDDSGYSVSVVGANQFFELNYSDGAKFLIDASGRSVWGDFPPRLSMDYLATYLRGPVMGFVLRRRGLLALHASSVRIGDHAVLICGESQSGKSTTVAALALDGTPVLSEDITVIEMTPEGIYAQPGHPLVGLWPDAVRVLMGSEDALPRFTEEWEKRVLDLRETTGGFDSIARQISAIYLLHSRSRETLPTIQHLDTQETFLALLQNTYMNWILTSEQRRIEFDQLARLTMAIPVRRILPHEGPLGLRELGKLLITDSRLIMSTRDLSYSL